MRFHTKNLWNRLAAGRNKSAGHKPALASVSSLEHNPLAALKHPCPSTPSWKDMRHSVLLRAEAVAKEDETEHATAMVERLQFATAIALFVVIACCIIGLLVPFNTSSGDVMFGNSYRDNSAGGASEPTLAFFQHP